MDMKKVEEQKKKWESSTLEKTLSKAKERKDPFKTLSGIELDRLYTPLEGKDSDYSEQIGFPGDYPFTRGIQPTMYRGRFWTMRQYAGFGSAEDTNKRYKYLLEQGQTGLSVAFDLPTQMGYDSTHALAAGEVGKVGVAIDSLTDMETLFDWDPPRQGLHLDDHQLHGGHPPGHVHDRCRKAGRRDFRASRERSRTMCSRNTSPGEPTSILPVLRCGSLPTSLPSVTRVFPSGT